MRYGALTLLLVLLFGQQMKSKEQKLVKISAIPNRTPLVYPANVKVEIRCEWGNIKGTPGFFGKQKLTLWTGNTQIDQNEYNLTERKIDSRWRPSNKISINSPYAGRISLTYVTKLYENNEFVCRVIYRRHVAAFILDWFEHHDKLTINVVSPPNLTKLEVVSASESNGAIFANKLAIIRCTVVLGMPEAEDKYFKLTAPGYGPHNTQISRIDQKSASKKIYELNRTLTAESNGKAVICFAKNSKRLSSSKTLYLNVLYGPRDMKLSVANKSVHENTTIIAGQQITCSANGNPKPIVHISCCNGSSSKQKSKASLAIPNRTQTNDYDVICTATNKVAEKKTNFAVKIVSAVRDIEISMAKGRLHANATIVAGQQITCSATGNPEPSVFISCCTVSSVSNKDKHQSNAAIIIPKRTKPRMCNVNCTASNNVHSETVLLPVKVVSGVGSIKMLVRNKHIVMNQRIFRGQKIRCTANWYIKPTVVIKFLKFPLSEKSWAGNKTRGSSKAIFTIPTNAAFDFYVIACSASNEFGAKFIKLHIRVAAKLKDVAETRESTTYIVIACFCGFVAIAVFSVATQKFHSYTRRQKKKPRSESESSVTKANSSSSLDNLR